MSSRNFLSKKRNISDCFDTFFEEQKKIGDYSSILFARDTVELLFGGNF